MQVRSFKARLSLFLVVGMSFALATVVQASSFKVGETILAGFPAPNIKDDAFIIGQITQITANGDYQISVVEYVKGHDYGLSCVPMVKNETNDGYGEGWAQWKDTTKLETEKLQYKVAKKDVRNLAEGKHYFIERNNLDVVFGRWESDAPMLTVDRLESAKNDAKAINLLGIIDALEVAKLHRQSFYDEFGRPYMSFESVPYLNSLLDHIVSLLQQDRNLNQLWQAKERDWLVISQDARSYFLVQAIDKSIADAKSLLGAEDIEKADAKQFTALKEKLMQLQRN